MYAHRVFSKNKIIIEITDNYCNIVKYGNQKWCNIGIYRKIRIRDFFHRFLLK